MDVGAAEAPTVRKSCPSSGHGIDVVKSIFQVRGLDAEGNVVIRRQIERRYVLALFQKPPRPGLLL
jgi:hypothetical protein